MAKPDSQAQAAPSQGFAASARLESSTPLLSRRDEFAKAALEQLIALHSVPATGFHWPPNKQQLAQTAVALADALILELEPLPLPKG